MANVDDYYFMVMMKQDEWKEEGGKETYETWYDIQFCDALLLLDLWYQDVTITMPNAGLL